MKDEKEAHIPYLSPAAIEREAEAFRRKYWDESLPVDIEHIVDVRMDLRIVPVPGLYASLGIKAYISSNWKEIMVDKGAYENERLRLALNYSYAHEIGHLVLHKEIYDALRMATMADYYCFTEEKNSDGNSFHRNAEIQANMFAKFLMIPTAPLRMAKAQALDRYPEELKKQLEKVDLEMVNEYLAVDLSEKFGVSDVAVKNALNKLPE